MLVNWTPLPCSDLDSEELWTSMKSTRIMFIVATALVKWTPSPVFTVDLEELHDFVMSPHTVVAMLVKWTPMSG